MDDSKGDVGKQSFTVAIGTGTGTGTRTGTETGTETGTGIGIDIQPQIYARRALPLAN